MITLVTVDHDHMLIELQALEATAASGEVLLGSPSDYTDKNIREWANSTLCAPDPIQNYNFYTIIRPY